MARKRTVGKRRFKGRTGMGQFKVGDLVIESGFPAVVTKVHTDIRRGMVDVRLPGGLATVDVKSLKRRV